MGSQLALEKRWEMLAAGAAVAMAVTQKPPWADMRRHRRVLFLAAVGVSALNEKRDA